MKLDENHFWMYVGVLNAQLSDDRLRVEVGATMMKEPLCQSMLERLSVLLQHFLLIHGQGTPVHVTASEADLTSADLVEGEAP